jgi:hypothetical protein
LRSLKKLSGKKDPHDPAEAWSNRESSKPLRKIASYFR